MILFALTVLFARAEPQATAAGGTADRLEFKVLKTYVVKDGIHILRAYVIEWKGSEVVALDHLALTNAHTDDTITVLVNRLPYPQGREKYGLLSFSVMAPKGRRNTSALETASGDPGSVPNSRPWQVANLKVLKVYSTEDEGCLFRAYVVEWAGQEAIVSDQLVQGRYEEGDVMTTLVMKHPFPRGAEAHGLLQLQAERPRATIRRR